MTANTIAIGTAEGLFIFDRNDGSWVVPLNYQLSAFNSQLFRNGKALMDV
ncbi:MAG: hypothetical protein IPN69_06220 [Acidobacteria bacterium]|nr:hypothetical protein [Acidobacteriota bacterium]